MNSDPDSCYLVRRTGGKLLPTYRLYRLDGAGRIVSADWLDAGADEDALSKARTSGDGRFELWERNRLIGQFGSGTR